MSALGRVTARDSRHFQHCQANPSICVPRYKLSDRLIYDEGNVDIPLQSSMTLTVTELVREVRRPPKEFALVCGFPSLTKSNQVLYLTNAASTSPTSRVLARCVTEGEPEAALLDTVDDAGAAVDDSDGVATGAEVMPAVDPVAVGVEKGSMLDVAFPEGFEVLDLPPPHEYVPSGPDVMNCRLCARTIPPVMVYAPPASVVTPPPTFTILPTSESTTFCVTCA